MAVARSIFVPAPARFSPDSVFHEFIFPRVEFFHWFVLDVERSQILLLKPRHHVNDILYLSFNGDEDWPITDGRVWPQRHEIVRILWCGDTEIR